MLKKSVLVTAVFVLILGLMVMPASAKWPKKAIQIMIPWPAGNDPSTLVATAMAPYMAKELGVPVKVVNKPGGGAVLATSELARSRLDGHMLGLISIGPMITQVIRGKTPYQNQEANTVLSPPSHR